MAGFYEVSAWWTYYPSGRSSTVTHRVSAWDGLWSVVMDQSKSGLGGQWNVLGTYGFEAGQSGYMEVLSHPATSCADAVRFVYVGTLEDVEPPTLVATTATSTTVDVEFSEEVDATTAETVPNYSVDQGVTVVAASLLPDGVTVRLTTSGNTANVPYTLTVNNVEDTSGNAISPNSQVAYEYVADVTPPVLLSAASPSPTAVDLTFSEALDLVSAQTVGNYGIGQGVTVLSAVLDVDDVTVHLTTSSHAAGPYTVTVNDVTDLQGNPVAANSQAPYGVVIDIELIIDNLDANVTSTGTWKSSSAAGYWGTNSVWNSDGSSYFRFLPTFPVAGFYEVSAWWTYYATRSARALYRIDHAEGTSTAEVNQRDQSLAGQWNLLGTYAFEAGTGRYVEASSGNGEISADAARFVYVGPPGDSDPPAAPTNLVATPGNQQVSLDWDDNTEPDLGGYLVYRSATPGGPYDALTPAAIASSNYVDATAVNGTPYYYVVTAVDESANESTASNEASATAEALGQIAGSVWDDHDGEGDWDTGTEPGRQGWTVFIDDNDDGVNDPGERSTTTASDGSYAFTDVPVGTHVVRAEHITGWMQTFPAGAGAQSASAGSGGEADSSWADAGELSASLTTTASAIEVEPAGILLSATDAGMAEPLDAQSSPLIRMDEYRADERFTDVDGSGFAAVILDTGIDLDHSFFGPDGDGDGVADRIVYHYDFADGDDDASDFHNHGSNVSSIIASSDATYLGIAPGVDIIHLKVFESGDGSGHFGYIEDALQWVVAHAGAYNIASVNMSLGDTANYSTATSLYGIGDELAALAGMDVIVASASGNDFYEVNSIQGVSYPAADPNSLSIGAVYDANIGGVGYGGGAVAYSTAADRIAPFSQRDDTLTTVMAPGAAITGASKSGGLSTMHGTSQASPQVAGLAVLAQDLATKELGRRLTFAEIESLLRSTAVTINDGDDEDDNVTNTGLDFPRVDAMALAEAIAAMAPEAVGQSAVVTAGQTTSGVDFGQHTNYAPVAADDAYATDEDTDLVVSGTGVLDGDTDTNGDPLTAHVIDDPLHGILTLNTDGSFTYSPDPDYNGPDSFTYRANDGLAVSNTATVDITVNSVNDAPVCQNDFPVVTEDTTNNVILVLDNDDDADNDPLTVISVAAASNGTATNATTHVTYTPNLNFTGQDTFGYTVSDGNGGTDTATVTVTVSSVNDDPVADSDADTVIEDSTANVIDVLGNDTDADNDTLSVASVTDPPNGTAVNQGTHVDYTPDADYFGIDTFDYTVSDGNGGTDTATVTITVTNVPDAPDAVNDSDTVPEDSTGNIIDVLVNDDDADDDPLTITSVTDPPNGSTVNAVTHVEYTPDANYAGQDTFDYTVSDGNGGFDTATVTIVVNSVNDPPTVVQAIADVVVDEDAGDTLIPLASVFDDADPGDILAYTRNIDDTAGHVAEIVDDVSLASYTGYLDDQLYTHTGDNRGLTGAEHDLARDNIEMLLGGFGLATSLDPFTYLGSTYYNVVGVKPGTTRPDDIYIVGAHYDSVNNPGADDNASGVSGVLEAARVLSGYDLEATVVFLAFDREEQGLYGSTAYVAEHTADNILGMVNLDMIAYNPDGANKDKVRLYDWVSGGQIKGDLIDAFDSYGNGVLAVDSGQNGQSDHRPFENAGFDATLIIEHEVWNNPYYHQQTDTVDTPNYIDYGFATNVTSAVVGYIATQAETNNPDLLTATVNGAELTLDFGANENGTATITVRCTDLAGAWVEDTFTVTVNAVNDAPDAVDDPATVDEDSVDNIIDVLANDSDVESQPLTVTDVSLPLRGVASAEGSHVEYTPDPGFFGSDSFTYTVSDGHGGTDTATVNVTVEATSTPAMLSPVDWGEQPRWKDIAFNGYDPAMTAAYTYDTPTVAITYENEAATFTGDLTATGLKANFAYQLKLNGKPTRLVAASSVAWPAAQSDDWANEQLGYAGRWYWKKVRVSDGVLADESGAATVSDGDYEAKKASGFVVNEGGTDYWYAFEGYLLFDYIVTDADGSVDKSLWLDSSFHVIWQDWQRTREANDSTPTTHTVIAEATNPWYDATHAQVDVELYAEHQDGRDLPGDVVLAAGTYNVRLFLTEESFHQSGANEGDWGTFLTHDDIAFTIPAPPPPGPSAASVDDDLDILVSPPNGPAPLEIDAIALGVSPDDVCKWDFGDGVTGTGRIATHTYLSSGTYTLTLTVGTRTRRATVVVGP